MPGFVSFRALRIFGSLPSGNSTSTTGPMTWTTLPRPAAEPFVAEGDADWDMARAFTMGSAAVQSSTARVRPRIGRLWPRVRRRAMVGAVIRARDVLGPGSPLSQALPGWEHREGQLEMAEAVGAGARARSSTSSSRRAPARARRSRTSCPRCSAGERSSSRRRRARSRSRSSSRICRSSPRRSPRTASRCGRRS